MCRVQSGSALNPHPDTAAIEAGANRHLIVRVVVRAAQCKDRHGISAKGQAAAYMQSTDAAAGTELSDEAGTGAGQRHAAANRRSRGVPGHSARSEERRV